MLAFIIKCHFVLSLLCCSGDDGDGRRCSRTEDKVGGGSGGGDTIIIILIPIITLVCPFSFVICIALRLGVQFCFCPSSTLSSVPLKQLTGKAIHQIYIQYYAEQIYCKAR